MRFYILIRNNYIKSILRGLLDSGTLSQVFLPIIIELIYSTT